eukprot:CAMPEP_0117844330 /NCGR_PEP_ID=MMETSP0949-20121206/17477_1 /TAXON_ID=44440 /ORGANISM="Chattonella subsalsa, Strain CCMP2191" /LENGTH=69 /DNA_ID=CAMNT_0005689411 /DNA_START=1 /DNA_END=210 /DNA_ORIENTATION=-
MVPLVIFGVHSDGAESSQDKIQEEDNTLAVEVKLGFPPLVLNQRMDNGMFIEDSVVPSCTSSLHNHIEG